MGTRKKDYPIVLGRNLNKGLMAVKKDGGINIAVVWLKDDCKGRFKGGEYFPNEDVALLDHEIRICDRETLDTVIQFLETVQEMWKEEDI